MEKLLLVVGVGIRSVSGDVATFQCGGKCRENRHFQVPPRNDGAFLGLDQDCALPLFDAKLRFMLAGRRSLVRSSLPSSTAERVQDRHVPRRADERQRPYDVEIASCDGSDRSAT